MSRPSRRGATSPPHPPAQGGAGVPPGAGAERSRFDQEFLARWESTPPEEEQAPTRPAGEQALLALGGETPVLLRLRDIAEIVPFVPPVPLAGAPREVLGLTTVRGDVLTVVRLESVLEGGCLPSEGQPPGAGAGRLPDSSLATAGIPRPRSESGAGAVLRYLVVVEGGGIRFALGLEDVLDLVRLEDGDDPGLPASEGGSVVVDVGQIAARIFESG